MTKQTNTQQASSKSGKSLIGRRLTLLLLCDDDAMISSPKMLLDMQTQSVGLVFGEVSYRLVAWDGDKVFTRMFPPFVVPEDEI